MKVRSLVLTITICMIASATCFAAHWEMGTWKLNESKSKLNPTGPKNHTVIYSAEGDKIKIIVDGIDAGGKAIHHEWVGLFDEKDYPVVGDQDSDARAYKKVDDHTIQFTVKKSGKVVSEGEAIVSPDGKTRTVTVKAVNDKGEEVTTVGVYDKQ